MPLPPPPLVGSVVERPPSSSSSRTAPSLFPSGFPAVQHRSKSAFARAREAKRNGTRESESKRGREVPTVRSSGDLLSGRKDEEEDLVPGGEYLNELSHNTRSYSSKSVLWVL